MCVYGSFFCVFGEENEGDNNGDGGLLLMNESDGVYWRWVDLFIL